MKMILPLVALLGSLLLAVPGVQATYPFKPECKVGATTLQKIVVELDYQGSFVPFKIDIIESFKSNGPVLCTIGRIEVPHNTQYKYNVRVELPFEPVTRNGKKYVPGTDWVVKDIGNCPHTFHLVCGKYYHVRTTQLDCHPKYCYSKLTAPDCYTPACPSPPPPSPSPPPPSPSPPPPSPSPPPPSPSPPPPSPSPPPPSPCPPPPSPSPPPPSPSPPPPSPPPPLVGGTPCAHLPVFDIPPFHPFLATCPAVTPSDACSVCNHNGGTGSEQANKCICCVSFFTSLGDAPFTPEQTRGAQVCQNMMTNNRDHFANSPDKYSVLENLYKCLVATKDSANHVYACQNCGVNKDNLADVMQCTACVQAKYGANLAPWDELSGYDRQCA